MDTSFGESSNSHWLEFWKSNVDCESRICNLINNARHNRWVIVMMGTLLGNAHECTPAYVHISSAKYNESQEFYSAYCNICFILYFWSCIVNSPTCIVHSPSYVFHYERSLTHSTPTIPHSTNSTVYPTHYTMHYIPFHISFHVLCASTANHTKFYSFQQFFRRMSSHWRKYS